MKKSIPVYKISLPEYTLDKKPNYDKIGKKLDTFIQNHFLGKRLCIRALGSQDHSLAKEELIQRILESGTDKYDSQKKSFWHEWEIYKDKGIDLFACFKEMTTIKYAEKDIGADAWKFRNPKRKKEALLGIIKVN